MNISQNTMEISAAAATTMGIYVHIPFCQHKCLYCDFYSIERTQHMGDFVDVLIEEIRLRAAEGIHANVPVNSIFFGGGTPSLLAPEQMERVCAELSQHFRIDADCEWTMECNPGTVTAESLAAYRALGVNRLSFGVQSFIESELRFLERIHSPSQAEEAIALARKAGFENINLDLMFALPEQTAESYAYSLNKALELGTEHISAYSLIYEEGTPLFAMLQKGQVTPSSEESDSQLYEYTMSVLAKHGYTQYEVSNFARAGKECRHNLMYWQAGEYLAFGPSAHGYRNGRRFWNFRNLSRYMEAVRRGELPIANSEELDSINMLFERAFLELRSQGIDIQRFRKDFGVDIPTACADLYFMLLKEGLATLTTPNNDSQNERLSLTARGYMVCDEITLRLIARLEEITQRQWSPPRYSEEQETLLPIL